MNNAIELFQKLGPKHEVDAFLKRYQSKATHSFSALCLGPHLDDTDIAIIAKDLSLLNEVQIAPKVFTSSDSQLTQLKSLIPSSLDLSITTNMSSTPTLPPTPSEFQKIIIVSKDGQLISKTGAPIPFLNLSFESEWSQIISDEDKQTLSVCRQLLATHQKGSISITRPSDLLKEMFTAKGAGTFLKFHSIAKANHLSELDLGKLKALIESAFGKALKSDYFDSTSFSQLIYQTDYEGVAIVKTLDSNATYLDKFAVDPIVSGTGLGKSLWTVLCETHPNLIWRASHSNPFNTFYFTQSDGHIKSNTWQVFWRGAPPTAKEISTVEHLATSFEESLSETQHP